MKDINDRNRRENKKAEKSSGKNGRTGLTNKLGKRRRNINAKRKNIITSQMAQSMQLMLAWCHGQQSPYRSAARGSIFILEGS
jgi:hypothetical protein